MKKITAVISIFLTFALNLAAADPIKVETYSESNPYNRNVTTEFLKITSLEDNLMIKNIILNRGQYVIVNLYSGKLEFIERKKTTELTNIEEYTTFLNTKSKDSDGLIPKIEDYKKVLERISKIKDPKSTTYKFYSPYTGIKLDYASTYTRQLPKANILEIQIVTNIGTFTYTLN